MNYKYILLLCFSVVFLLPVQGQFLDYLGLNLVEDEQEFQQSAKDSNGYVYFLTNNNRTSLSALHKYNGSFWVSSKGTPIMQNFGKLIPFDNEVLISNQKNHNNTVMHWNGKEWSADTCLYAAKKGVDSTINLVKHRGKVYFFGSAFRNVGSASHNGSAVYDGKTWSKTAVNYPKFIFDGMSMFDTLFLLGNWRGQGPNKMYTYFNDVLIDSLADVNFMKATENFYFYSLGTTWYFNDGNKLINLSDSLKGAAIQQIIDVDEWGDDILIYGGVAGSSKLYSTKAERSMFINNFKNPRLHVTKYGHFISPAVNNSNEFSYLGKIEWNAAKVEGKMFLDKDGDCFFTTIDQVLPYKAVYVGDRHTLTDENGDYSLILPVGITDSLQFYKASFDSLACGTIAKFTTALDSTLDLDLAIVSKREVKDFRVDVSGGIVRHGKKTFYKVTVENIGSIQDTTKQVFVKFDSRLINFESSTSHIINGNNAIFTSPVLKRNEKWDFVYSLYVDETQLNLGDSIYTYLEMDNRNEIDSSNNFDTLKQFVISAYDPNLKKCLPYGEVKEELDVIKYTIHFQNTGTDTAFRVIVVDTLERNLPIEKVQVIGLSHPKYNLKVIGNTVIWTFDDILLPDSGKDFAGSQGWIKFNVKLKRDLEIGDSIRNRAHIYFDYQSPITTNYARVLRIEQPIDSVPEDEVKILVYPNPAHNYIDIKNNESKDIQFVLFDITGRRVLEEEVKTGEVKKVNIAFLSTGFYIMRYEEGCIGKLFISE